MPRQRTSGLDFEALHRLHMQNYERLITKAYDRAIYEAVAIAITLPKGKPLEELFSFDKHPASKKRVEAMMSGLQGRMQGIIEQGMRAEWTLANNKTDALVKRVFGNKLNDEAKHRLLSNNEDAREAFIQRKEKGLGLSDRVWRYTEQFKSEIEMGLDIGIRGGKSADELSRALRGFLREPNKLFRRVRDEHGQLKLSARAKAYHPGQGVYRSSYKNALRLAVTETNIAYRTADHERQKALDFVVGIEVHLSGNHTLNGKPFKCMCDDLVGKYPKDFKFTGWHPHCRCYTTPILKTPEEMARDTQKLLRGEPVDGHSVNEVKDLPQGFKTWVAQYKDKLKTAVSVPYFLQDNPQYIGDAEYPDWYILKQKAELKEQRKKTLAWGKQALIGKKIVRPDFDQPITFTVCGLKEAINQPHKNYKEKNEALRHIDLLIQQGEYVGSAGDIKGRPFTYHYLKIKIRGIDSFIVLREEKGSLSFYSLVERRKDDSQENSLGYTVRASSESHLSHHKDKQKSLLERAKARHEARSLFDRRLIMKNWEERSIVRRYADELPEYIDEKTRLSIARNSLILEKTLGVTKGSPMGIDEADKQSANPRHIPKYIRDENGIYKDKWGHRLKVNPEYKEDAAKPYSTNCATCTAAYLLRTRGFPVIAKGNIKGSLVDAVRKGGWLKLFESADGSPIEIRSTRKWAEGKKYKAMTPGRYKEFFEESCEEPGIYLLSISWKDGGGHCTILQRMTDGRLLYIEPQVDNSDRDRTSLFSLLQYGTTRISSYDGVFRIDDKLFNLEYMSILAKDTD